MVGAGRKVVEGQGVARVGSLRRYTAPAEWPQDKQDNVAMVARILVRSLALLAAAFSVSDRARAMAMRGNVARRPKRLLERHPSIDPTQCAHIAKDLQARRVHPGDFHDGTLLEKLAEEHVRTFGMLLPERKLVCVRVVSWGSLCSGSDGIHFVMQA